MLSPTRPIHLILIVALALLGQVLSPDSALAEAPPLKLTARANPYPRIDAPLTLSVGDNLPRSSRRYTYLVRYDADDRWTVLQHRTAATAISWTPTRPGNVEFRVDAVAPDAPEVRDTIRLTIRTGREPVRMEGRSSLVMGDFPAYDGVQLMMDDHSVVLGRSTRIQILLREPRNSRRITVLEKHADDREWRMLHENPARLIFYWRPSRIGQYQLRVDVVGARDERHQINAICLDPSAPSRSRMRGR